MTFSFVFTFVRETGAPCNSTFEAWIGLHLCEPRGRVDTAMADSAQSTLLEPLSPDSRQFGFRTKGVIVHAERNLINGILIMLNLNNSVEDRV